MDGEGGEAGTIASARLDLVPMGARFLEASLGGDTAAAERSIGATLPGGWPDAGVRHTLELRLDQLRADPELEPWLLRAMVRRSDRVAVGHIGFHGRPGGEHLEPLAPGAAEFGYTVFEPFRRQGYAREAAVALMRWAVRRHGIGRFVVSIDPDNLASQALAQQLGFVKIGTQLDEIDGVEDVLERRGEV